MTWADKESSEGLLAGYPYYQSTKSTFAYVAVHQMRSRAVGAGLGKMPIRRRRASDGAG